MTSILVFRCCFPLFNMKLTGNFLLLCFEISLHGILKSDGLSVYRCKLMEGDQFCWCAMIVGYGMLGNSAGSIDFFTEMLKDGVHPNDVAFTSILSTCSHTGMVTAWKKYFHSMAQHFNITPSTKHFACVVHVLARAGNLEQVLEFIYKNLRLGPSFYSVYWVANPRVTVTYKKSLVLCSYWEFLEPNLQ